ncbi:hypothetical protein H4R18_001998 [Coemansia javaensis]|uniref:HMG box domain-containing protein n=1 Tax=Coemansia javaensis TaxID=2761396 RepID=A0A9W8HDH2_9FUNG|nr:hypothetical protein H4R18_001998 [Coemansia javaensis]
MSSISSILAFESSPVEQLPAPESTAYTRSSSVASLPTAADMGCASRSMTPSTYGAGSSCQSSPAMAMRVLTSRPPNSFILYRSDKLRGLVQQYPDLKQTQISKMCAENWKKESAEVREYYRRKQQEAKALFLSEQAQEVERISGGASDKTIIKRIQPTNTFIRYRTEMKKKLASQFAAMNQKDVSRACGLMWRSEPEHVKMRYRQSYNKEKRDFERLCSSSVLDEQPSREALSALASVIAEAAKAGPGGSSSSSNAAPAATGGELYGAASADKKRRLSEGCHSAPASPPQADKDHVRSKRLRSFHTPTRPALLPPTASPVEAPQTVPSPQSSGSISLPSCASLLSMAGTSPFPAPAPARSYGHARAPSALDRPLLPFHKQPEHAHRAFPPPYYAHQGGHPAAALPPAHLYMPPPLPAHQHYHHHRRQVAAPYPN